MHVEISKPHLKCSCKESNQVTRSCNLITGLNFHSFSNFTSEIFKNISISGKSLKYFPNWYYFRKIPTYHKNGT